jgi:hypothetical protein
MLSKDASRHASLEAISIISTDKPLYRKWVACIFLQNLVLHGVPTFNQQKQKRLHVQLALCYMMHLFVRVYC